MSRQGGLADVVGTLPNVLARSGEDVRVILPKYSAIAQKYKDEMKDLLYFFVNLGLAQAVLRHPDP